MEYHLPRLLVVEGGNLNAAGTAERHGKQFITGGLLLDGRTDPEGVELHGGIVRRPGVDAGLFLVIQRQCLRNAGILLKENFEVLRGEVQNGGICDGAP